MGAEQKDLNIALVGVGGVGGYLGGLLVQAFPQTQLVVRGARGERMLQDGFALYSETNGEIFVRPQHVVPSADLLKSPDILFVTVKNYSLDTVIGSLKGAVRPDTILMPVMNGVTAAEKLQAAFPANIVLSSVIYVVAALQPDGSVTQTEKNSYLELGTRTPDAAHLQAVQTVHGVLQKAGVDARQAENIEAAVWHKFLLNCAFNVETAAYGQTIGQLREDPVKAQEYEALIHEAFAVADARGIGVDHKFETIFIRRFAKYAYDASSSLLRDLQAGKQTEYQIFSSYIAQEAHRLGVSVPVTEKMDALIRQQVQEQSA